MELVGITKLLVIMAVLRPILSKVWATEAFNSIVTLAWLIRGHRQVLIEKPVPFTIRVMGRAVIPTFLWIMEAFGPNTTNTTKAQKLFSYLVFAALKSQR